MTDKDYNKLMELAKRKLQEKVTKEEALRSLVQAGILDESGKFTSNFPYLAAASGLITDMRDVD